MSPNARQTTTGPHRIDRRLCGDWLRALLTRDGWTLQPAADPAGNRDQRRAAPESVAAYRARKDGRRIWFFFSDQPRRQLTAAFRAVQRRDRGRFRLLGVLIVPTDAEMQRWRGARWAGRFPRAFFTSAPELRNTAALAGDVAAGPPDRRPSLRPPGTGGAATFRARVLANIPVGGPGSSHYRLAFQAPELQEVQPPQFVMMDTTPARVPLGARSVRRGPGKPAIDPAPSPLLKRPFGICRDFHPGFAGDYLRNLRLPPSLASALHLAAPDHFEMLYKVLPDGLGTAQMTKLRRGQQVHMVGPLGRAYDVRALRAEGIEEVHVIGGGVGMAPLILLVESLRYHSIPLKVFLGIATLESLRYRDELAATFGEKPKDAYVYLDDLLAAGVGPGDLYVSCDSRPPSRIVRGIPRANLYHGLVPDQYRRYLESRFSSAGHRTGGVGSRKVPERNPRSMMAFTCGPNRMMEIVADIAGRAGIRLKVLLEKRMGCGIGVCFSCVQRVRRPNGAEDYARICTEGPLFDASDILWKNDDSKPPSAPSACAARC